MEMSAGQHEDNEDKGDKDGMGCETLRQRGMRRGSPESVLRTVTQGLYLPP
jgi:hypothetical protein